MIYFILITLVVGLVVLNYYNNDKAKLAEKDSNKYNQLWLNGVKSNNINNQIITFQEKEILKQSSELTHFKELHHQGTVIIESLEEQINELKANNEALHNKETELVNQINELHKTNQVLIDSNNVLKDKINNILPNNDIDDMSNRTAGEFCGQYYNNLPKEEIKIKATKVAKTTINKSKKS